MLAHPIAPYLAYISPISPPYLPISPMSPLYLPFISPISPLYLARSDAVLAHVGDVADLLEEIESKAGRYRGDVGEI